MTATRSRSLVRPPRPAPAAAPVAAKPAVPAEDPALAFAAAATGALARGELDAIPDASLHRALAAAARVFAAKSEKSGGAVAPFPDGTLTATETVVAVCAMIRAADLSPFDIAMWFNRLPGGERGR